MIRDAADQVANPRPPGIFVGTSGWHYKPWVGPFYAEGTKPPGFLDAYKKLFSTVEINQTFYGLPKPESVVKWREQTPPDFLFACKMSRFITHMKKLKEPETGLGKYFGVVENLGEKLGPILVQLPPMLGINLDRIEGFFQAAPKQHRYTFEFRERGWFTDETYAALAKWNASLCLYDFDGWQSPVEVTADWVYIRLHGPEGRYGGSYNDDTLALWADRIVGWSRSGRDVYCYFDNDQKGYAPNDALRLIGILRGFRLNTLMAPAPL